LPSASNSRVRFEITGDFEEVEMMSPGKSRATTRKCNGTSRSGSISSFAISRP
jgi:hypothetical protein